MECPKDKKNIISPGTYSIKCEKVTNEKRGNKKEKRTKKTGKYHGNCWKMIYIFAKIVLMPGAKVFFRSVNILVQSL